MMPVLLKPQECCWEDPESVLSCYRCQMCQGLSQGSFPCCAAAVENSWGIWRAQAVETESCQRFSHIFLSWLNLEQIKVLDFAWDTDWSPIFKRDPFVESFWRPFGTRSLLGPLPSKIMFPFTITMPDWYWEAEDERALVDSCWFPNPWLMISEGWSLCYATQYMWDYHNPWAEKPINNQYCSAGDAEKWRFAKTWGALAEANDAQRLQMLEARLDAWTARATWSQNPWRII